MIHLAGLKETFLDFPNSEDIAVILFTYGCSHNCMGCQSPSLQDPFGGEVFSKEELLNLILDRCKGNATNKIVFSGGDPLYHTQGSREQMEDLLWIVDYLERNGYECCIYTGYTYEQVKSFYPRKLLGPKFFKCGRYMESLKDKGMGKYEDSFILASTNQRFLVRIEDTQNYQSSESHIIHI